MVWPCMGLVPQTPPHMAQAMVQVTDPRMGMDRAMELRDMATAVAMDPVMVDRAMELQDTVVATDQAMDPAMALQDMGRATEVQDTVAAMALQDMVLQDMVAVAMDPAMDQDMVLQDMVAVAMDQAMDPAMDQDMEVDWDTVADMVLVSTDLDSQVRTLFE
jgi:hypothetical protein